MPLTLYKNGRFGLARTSRLTDQDLPGSFQPSQIYSQDGLSDVLTYTQSLNEKYNWCAFMFPCHVYKGICCLLPCPMKHFQNSCLFIKAKNAPGKANCLLLEMTLIEKGGKK